MPTNKELLDEIQQWTQQTFDFGRPTPYERGYITAIKEVCCILAKRERHDLREEHVQELEDRNCKLEKEKRTVLYWLLRAHQSGHREGWEPGPSVEETMQGCRIVLRDNDLEPNSEEAMIFLRSCEVTCLREIEKERDAQGAI